MPAYVALLRAVNVGARQVPMAALRTALADAGFGEVETYIQTGNLLVRSPTRTVPAFERRLETSMADICGFPVDVIARTPDELIRIAARGADLDDHGLPPSRHFVYFLKTALPADAATAIGSWTGEGEWVHLDGRELHYWRAVDANKTTFDRSGAGKKAGGVGTARNWNVITTLADRWGTAS